MTTPAAGMVVGMRTLVSVVACLLIVGVIGSCSSQPGHRGGREDDAARVTFNVYTRGMLWNKKRSNDYYAVRRGAYVRLWPQRKLVNESDHNV